MIWRVRREYDRFYLELSTDGKQWWRTKATMTGFPSERAARDYAGHIHLLAKNERGSPILPVETEAYQPDAAELVRWQWVKLMVERGLYSEQIQEEAL